MIFMKSLLMGSALGCESSDCLEVTMVDGGTVEVSAERIVPLGVEMEGFGPSVIVIGA
jgi:hypothetical protein